MGEAEEQQRAEESYSQCGAVRVFRAIKAVIGNYRNMFDEAEQERNKNNVDQVVASKDLEIYF